MIIRDEEYIVYEIDLLHIVLVDEDGFDSFIRVGIQLEEIVPFLNQQVLTI
jgi:hypothetical protein